MTQSLKPGDREIRMFDASLTKLLGADNFPREVLGDLSDLLGTLRQVNNLLLGLMELRPSFERHPATKLHQLAISLGDLRLILNDLQVPLEGVAMTAFSIFDENPDEELAKLKRLLKKVESLRSDRGVRKS